MKKIKLLLLFFVSLLSIGVLASCNTIGTDEKEYLIKGVDGVVDPYISISDHEIKFNVENKVSSFPLANFNIKKGTVVAYRSLSNTPITSILDLKEGLNNFTLKVQKEDGTFVKNSNGSEIVWTLQITRAEKVIEIKDSVSLLKWKLNYNVGDSYEVGLVKVVKNNVVTFVDVKETMITGFDTTTVGEKNVTITIDNSVIETAIIVKEKIVYPTVEPLQPTELAEGTMIDTIASLSAVFATMQNSGEAYEQAYEEMRAWANTESGLTTVKYLIEMAEKSAITTDQLDGVVNFMKDDLVAFVNEISSDMANVSPEGNNVLDLIVETINNNLPQARELVAKFKQIIPARQLGEIVYQILSTEEIMSSGIYEHLDFFNEIGQIFYSKLNGTYEQIIYSVGKLYEDLDTILGIPAESLKTLIKFGFTLSEYLSGNSQVSNIMEFLNLGKESLVIIVDLFGDINSEVYLELIKTQMDSVLAYNPSIVFEKEAMYDIIDNMGGVFRFIDNLVSQLDEETIAKILNYIEMISNPSSSTTITVAETGRMFVDIAKVFAPAYQNLTIAEQIQLKKFISYIFVSSSVGNSMNMGITNWIDEMVTIILELSEYQLDTMSDAEATEACEKLIYAFQAISMQNRITIVNNINSFSDCVVPQGTTIDELIELLNQRYTINFFDAITGQNYSPEITIDMLSNVDLNTPGLKKLTVTYNDCKAELLYYVSSNDQKENYSLVYEMNECLVYELNNTIPLLPFNNRGIVVEYSVIEGEHNLVFNRIKQYSPNEIVVVGVQTNAVGHYYGAIKVEDELCGTLYIPVEYFVVDSTNPIITEIIPYLDKYTFVQDRKDQIEGYLGLQENYNIVIEGNSYYFSESMEESAIIDSSMVSGFDTSVIGRQTITITYKGFSTYVPIEIISKEDANKPSLIDVQIEGEYTIDNLPTAQDLFYIVETFAGDRKTGSYDDIMKFFEANNFDYEIEVSWNEIFKNEWNDMILSVIDNNTNQEVLSTVIHVYISDGSIEPELSIVDMSVKLMVDNPTPDMVILAIIEITVYMSNGAEFSGNKDHIEKYLESIGLSCPIYSEEISNDGLIGKYNIYLETATQRFSQEITISYGSIEPELSIVQLGFRYDFYLLFDDEITLETISNQLEFIEVRTNDGSFEKIRGAEAIQLFNDNIQILVIDDSSLRLGTSNQSFIYDYSYIVLDAGTTIEANLEPVSKEFINNNNIPEELKFSMFRDIQIINSAGHFCGLKEISAGKFVQDYCQLQASDTGLVVLFRGNEIANFEYQENDNLISIDISYMDLVYELESFNVDTFIDNVVSTTSVVICGVRYDSDILENNLNINLRDYLTVQIPELVEGENNITIEVFGIQKTITLQFYLKENGSKPKSLEVSIESNNILASELTEEVAWNMVSSVYIKTIANQNIDVAREDLSITIVDGSVTYTHNESRLEKTIQISLVDKTMYNKVAENVQTAVPIYETNVSDLSEFVEITWQELLNKCILSCLWYYTNDETWVTEAGNFIIPSNTNLEDFGISADITSKAIYDNSVSISLNIRFHQNNQTTVDFYFILN